MIVLRKPPYTDFADYTLTAETDYLVTIKKSDKDEVVYSDTLTSDEDGIVSIPWQVEGFDFSLYDETYALEIIDELEVVVQDNLTVERPYADPAELAPGEELVADYIKHERLARAIIDSVTGGFYYRNTDYDTVGQGTDYMPIWERVYKILKVYQNDVLVWDASLENPVLAEWNYVISKDKTAIIKELAGYSGVYNRSEQKPPFLNVGNSDSFTLFDGEDSGNTATIVPGVAFAAGTDYVFELETGYKVVPYDITEAATMLVDDIACGKLEYYKRYISSYSTDQYRIRIENAAFEGTGNILVDKILEKYITDVKKPGVL